MTTIQRRAGVSRRGGTLWFWVTAAMLVLFLYASAAPTPLYRVYQSKWRFSAATLTAVFAIDVLSPLATLTDVVRQRAEDQAGPAVYLAGVTVLPEARQRGIAGAISSWLLTRGAAAAARVAHLHPDSNQAARCMPGWASLR